MAMGCPFQGMRNESHLIHIPEILDSLLLVCVSYSIEGSYFLFMAMQIRYTDTDGRRAWHTMWWGGPERPTARGHASLEGFRETVPLQQII